MIEILNRILVGCAGALFFPLRSLDPWFAMAVMSLISALLLLAVFKYGSDQAKIRRARDRFVGRVIEMAVYRDDLTVTVGAFARVLGANALYILALLKPLCLGVVPFVLLLAQAGAWFCCRPLAAGESVVVKAALAPGTRVMERDFSLEGDGIEVEAGPVRAVAANCVYWRVRPVRVGAASLEVRAGPDSAVKTIRTADELAPLNPERRRGGIMRALLHPAEHPLPPDSAFTSISVAYPARIFDLWGLRMDWALVYIVLTIAIAWLLKGAFRVTI